MVGLRTFGLLGLGLATTLAQKHNRVPHRQHDQTFHPDAVLVFTVENTSLPCVGSRPTVLINGTAPGPEIRLKEGQTSWIRVYNNIPDENATMHWHGLSMSVSPFSDGTPLASQWPLAPNTFFDYEITPAIGEAGTYFYHSHVGLQAITAAGPLIVEDSGKPPYDYDDERIVFLHDVFAKSDPDMLNMLTVNPFKWPGETEMILVNGKGGGMKDVAAGNVSCNEPLPTINVAPDKTYRFRFIGGTALTFASLAFEGHSMTLIGVDGSYTMPQEIDHLQIGSGQRFDVLLKTMKGLGIANYHLQVESRERPTLAVGYAILSYSCKNLDLMPPSKPPIKLPETTYGWLDYELKPLNPNNFPQLSEVTRRVTMVNHQVNDSNTITWNINDNPWFENTRDEPYLISLIKNNETDYPNYTRALQNGGFDPVTKAFVAMPGEVLEIVLQNTGATSGNQDVHPFHAHGSHYYDIGSGNGTYDDVANEVRLNGTSPILRDTTMLYRYREHTTPNITMGWRAWRVRVTEPGVWMIHCHILQHMVMGMQTVWVIGNHSQLLTQVQAPDVAGYLTFGGSVYGTEDHYPTGIVHFQDNWASTQ